MGGSSKPLTIDRRRLDEFGSEMSSNNGAYDVRQGEIGNSQNMKLSDIFRPNRENSSNAVSNVVPQVQSSSTVVNTGLQYL